jgi:MOSC domain-containing protein YiiM
VELHVDEARAALKPRQDDNGGMQSLSTPLTGLYVGRARLLPHDSRSSGIFKQIVEGPLTLTRDGFEGDEQADRRVHGGAEKAVHHFPARNHARLAARFPELAAAFVPGAIGENLSTAEWDESDVCVGDVVALGNARLQLNQPRRPCWKIDARFAQEGIAIFVEREGIAGWYYRVLEPRTVGGGAAGERIDRKPGAPSLRSLHELGRAHRPPVDELLRVAALPGIAQGWAERLRARALWLRENAGG